MSGIIGLAGGTASGKTTLSRELTRALDAVCIPHDAYYKTLPDEYRGGRESAYNFDHPDALDTGRLLVDLATLRSGRAALIPAYDFATCRRLGEDTWSSVQPKPWIVVEGILVLAIPELRRQFDHLIYVECPDDIRLARRLRRDCVERGDAPETLLTQYLATVRPMHEQLVRPSAAFADLRVDGRSPVASSMAAALQLIRG